VVNSTPQNDDPIPCRHISQPLLHTASIPDHDLCLPLTLIDHVHCSNGVLRNIVHLHLYLLYRNGAKVYHRNDGGVPRRNSAHMGGTCALRPLWGDGNRHLEGNRVSFGRDVNRNRHLPEDGALQ
jgi:hypothetical protein